MVKKVVTWIRLTSVMVERKMVGKRAHSESVEDVEETAYERLVRKVKEKRAKEKAK